MILFSLLPYIFKFLQRWFANSAWETRWILKATKGQSLRKLFKSYSSLELCSPPDPPSPQTHIHTRTHTHNLLPSLQSFSQTCYAFNTVQEKGGRGFSILPDCCQCIHIKVACHMDFLLVYFESVLRAFDQDFGARTPSVGIKAAKKGAINRVRGELSTPIARWHVHLFNRWAKGRKGVF